jgi:hypothetical protein
LYNIFVQCLFPQYNNNAELNNLILVINYVSENKKSNKKVNYCITKMEQYNASNFTETTNSSTEEKKYGTGFESLGNDIFDSKHLAISMVVFWGTILLIVGGAAYCWCRCIRNGETRNDDQENNEIRVDNTRRDTVILNLRRQSRRDTLILPFTLH